MDSVSTGYWACSAMAFIAMSYKIRDLRKAPRQPMVWLICSTLFLIGLSIFLAAPAAIAFINRASGIPNIAAPVVYCLIIALNASALLLVTYWRDGEGTPWRAVRWWLAGATAAMATMIAFFILGDAPVERRIDFDTYYARTPYISLMIITYLLVHVSTSSWLAITALRWSRLAGRPWLRRGLRTIMAGSTLGVAFNVSKLAAVAARWAGGNLDDLSSRVAPGFAGLAVIISSAGFVTPLWGEKLSRYRAYRQLHPLWGALCESTPQIVPPFRIPRWNISLRLARRITEIRDGQLALRPYLDPVVAITAVDLGRRAGLKDVDLDAVVEASQIKAAIAAKARGERYPHGIEDPPPAPHGGDAIGEIDWLVRVSRAIDRSPLVGAALRSTAIDWHSTVDDSRRNAPLA